MGYTVGNTPVQVLSTNVHTGLGAIRNDMTFAYRLLYQLSYVGLVLQFR